MGAAQHHRRHGRHHRRLLGWDQAEVPEGGAAVYRSTTALTLSYQKDPAGHLFHLAALRQAGLYGASQVPHLRCLPLAAADCPFLLHLARLLRCLATLLDRGAADQPEISWRGSWPQTHPPARARSLPATAAAAPADDPQEEEEEAGSEATSTEPSRQGSTADFASLEDEAVAG